ncbi:MAG: prepilin-type N-terminal cleavage/methylation domain-containing protein [Bdellovibrionales bacterium]|nr:prepilin-type N-terminal cleavage/methylation domain-containing protein [Bdellovibrionales bacterium]
MTRNGENPWTRSRKKGFTLIEVVAATALLATLLTLTSLVWSNTFRRMQKSKQIRQIVILLEQKMNELETLYKIDTLQPLPEQDKGDFPENKNFTWQYETRPFTLPEALILLKMQQLPQNDTNSKVTQILKDILSESIIELKLTVTFKEKTKYSLSSYFINYKDAPAKVLSAVTNIVPTGGLSPSEDN